MLILIADRPKREQKRSIINKKERKEDNNSPDDVQRSGFGYRAPSLAIADLIVRRNKAARGNASSGLPRVFRDSSLARYAAI